MGLAWTEQLSVGNAIIDSEHKKLIDMVNGVRDAIRGRNSPMLPEAFVRLENWLDVHFANEEKIARALGFDFSSHRQAQQFSLKELQLMRDVLIPRNGIPSGQAAAGFARFLKKWLIDGHIIDLNMLMKPALQARDYTFWPCRKEGEVNHMAGRTASLYLQFIDTPVSYAA